MAGDPRLGIIKSYCRDRTFEVFSNDWWLGLLGVLDVHAWVVAASPPAQGGVVVRVALSMTPGGQWDAVGSSAFSDEEALRELRNYMPDSAVVVGWLNAPVVPPGPIEIPASVSAGEGT